MRLLVLPGDGIGPEITAATTAVLNAASARFGLGLELVEDVVGHASLAKYGATVRPEGLISARGFGGKGSINRTRIPARPRRAASASPAMPPPTMRISVFTCVSGTL